MANYPQHRRGFENDTSASDKQQITKDDKWIGHSVTGGATPGTIKLCDDGDKVWGSIAYFDSDQIIIIDEGEDVPFKNAGIAAIPIGSRIVGATRTIGTTKVYGYIKAFTPATASDADASSFTSQTEQEAAIDTAVNAAVDAALTAALKATGCVVDGGDTSTAKKDVPADVKVAFNRCA